MSEPENFTEFAKTLPKSKKQQAAELAEAIATLWNQNKIRWQNIRILALTSRGRKNANAFRFSSTADDCCGNVT